MSAIFLGKRLMLCAVVLGTVLWASSSARGQDTGEALFKSKCAMCHGPDGAGKTMMGEKLKIPDLHSDTVQKLTDAELNQAITKGKNSMPSYEGKVSKEQINSLVGFIRSLAKKH